MTERVIKRIRFLLDTNILIPLQDSNFVLDRSLASFVRLASSAGHQLLYHPASIVDFERDENLDRRSRNLQRIRQYTALDSSVVCPWNNQTTDANDKCDNEILYALECNAVHALVTEDRGLHKKARSKGLNHRVYTVQTAEDWLLRLHPETPVRLPNIKDVALHNLTPELSTSFFNSLRDGYIGFDRWFSEKAMEGRKAWVYRDNNNDLAAICIYDIQNGATINDNQERLSGKALKLCTFKVGQKVRGRKIGELFLKASFQYATKQECEHLFIHANEERHNYLVSLLEDFGFERRGGYKGDLVLVKKHPLIPPENFDYDPVEYVRRFYPHFRKDNRVQKFLIPIKPDFHRTLFPDYRETQLKLFDDSHFNDVGNAIKLAYLCHSPIQDIKEGAIVFFYRTQDEKAVTSVGVVEKFQILDDAISIAKLVSRRTVYSMMEIDMMARKPTKVILFRFVAHLPKTVAYEQLKKDRVVSGYIQSITKITDESFQKVLTTAGM